MAGFDDVFISYGRADSKSFAFKLHERLVEQGLKIWFDQEDIPLGVDFQNQINEGIEKAHNFVFLIAPHSVKSIYCRREIDLAVQCNKRIIPILHVMPQTQDVWEKMHPTIEKINWIYFQEDKDDFEKSFAGLMSLIQQHRDYVEQHTYFLNAALDWERNQKQTQYLLVGQDRKKAESWLKVKFKNEQPPCTPSDLHCEFICESIKNANNLMAQIFLSYAEQDREVMQKVRQSLMREAITIWTNKTDIKAGIDFQEAINNGIEGADRLVYLMSSNSLKSEYCQQELTYAKSLNKSIIILRVEEIDPETLPPEFRSIQFIDFAEFENPEKYTQGMNQLLKELQEDDYYYEQHKALLTKALKWQRQDRNSSILLHGHGLKKAENWLKAAQSQPKHPPLPLQIEFITASQNQPPISSLEVFLSYSRADSDFARDLNDALQLQGKTTWFDQESIDSGADFQQEIFKGIETSDNFVFVISPDSVNSPYCNDEVEYARKLNKRMITVLHRPIDPSELNETLSNLQWIDFNKHEGDFFANFGELVRTLDTDREHVHSHTKWSQRSLEWQQKEKSSDLLLRGSEFVIAENWLKEAEEQKKNPPPTDLQKEFIGKSEEAIQAEIRREKQRKRILKALLGLATGGLVVSTILGISAFKLYQQSLIDQIEAIADNSESLFASNHKLDALVAALQAKRAFKSSWTKPKELEQEIERVLGQSVYGSLERNRFIGHKGGVLGVAVSPDGSMIASSSNDRTIKLWKPDGELITTIKAHDARIYEVVFSPDGQTLASTSADNTAKLWKLDGSLIATLKGHQASVHSVAFSADGQTVATGSGDDTVKLWKLDGTLIKTLTGHTNTVFSVVFSPDGQYLASGADDKTIKLWNPDGTLITTLTGSLGGITTLTFSSGSKLLASAGYDNTIKLWNPQSGELLDTLRGHGSLIHSIAFNPDGSRLVSASNDNTIKVWKVEDQVLLTTIYGHNGPVHGVSFTPDGQQIISGSNDQSIRLWQLDNGVVTTYREHNDTVDSVAFSPDGKLLLTAAGDTWLKLWNTTGEDRTTALRSFKGHTARVWDAEFSPDGKTIFSGGEDKTIKMWSVEGQFLRDLKGHTDIVYDISFSPDGTWFASGSEDNTVILWKADGTKLKTLEGHTAPVWNVAIASDNTIASASDDSTIILWRPDGTMIRTLSGAHEATIYKVAWSPDGQMLASTSADNTVKLWNREGKLLQTFTGHGSSVFGLNFSPDGQMLASSSFDRTIKLWKLDGTLLATLNAHNGAVYGIDFSPDGKSLASGSLDASAIVWNLEEVLNTDSLLKDGCSWVQDYLKTNAELSEQDRQLCSDVQP